MKNAPTGVIFAKCSNWLIASQASCQRLHENSASHHRVQAGNWWQFSQVSFFQNLYFGLLYFKFSYLLQNFPHKQRKYYPGKKNRHSRDIREIDPTVVLCDIELWFNIVATLGKCASQVTLQIEVDVAWYRMIAPRINLMNISVATIFWPR